MVLKNGIVQAEDADEIVDNITIEISRGGVTKNQLLMLDIIANNNWERPIYFSGGSFDAKEYIWMKDYLQLDGLAYKLVPIKTPVDSRNPFEMGRVNTEIMYKNVKKWDWGNSESTQIYHDPETRRNSITYRSNMARLIEGLIKEDKLDKAEEMIDMAVTKMPVEYFGYYIFVEPFADGYYKVGQKEKGRALLNQIITKYQESLYYYSTLEINDQYAVAEDIISDIEYYSRLVDVFLANRDEIVVEDAVNEFNNYVKLFSHFYRDENKPAVNESSFDFPEDTPIQIMDSTEE
jgi:hypothetical protein